MFLGLQANAWANTNGFSSTSPSTTVLQATPAAMGLSSAQWVVDCECSITGFCLQGQWDRDSVLTAPNFSHFQSLKFSSASTSENCTFVTCYFWIWCFFVLFCFFLLKASMFRYKSYFLPSFLPSSSLKWWFYSFGGKKKRKRRTAVE